MIGDRIYRKSYYGGYPKYAGFYQRSRFVSQKYCNQAVSISQYCIGMYGNFTGLNGKHRMSCFTHFETWVFR
ncbi:hypothetical protein GALLN_00769 [Gallionellaceae bacterium]|nr:hypothetical protein GALLN_00769 [Gallionellaceae bacterium]